MKDLTSPVFNRRRVLGASLACAALSPTSLLAQYRPALADMHSHINLISRPFSTLSLAKQMREEGVALVAWKHVADILWTKMGETGVTQVREPAPGELAGYFERNMARMRAYLRKEGLRTVLTAADVDACLAGDPGVVLASEGADFLEGQVDRLAGAYQGGLRHLQLVHYIRTPVGDFQTEAPVHGGLSEMGRQLVQACQGMGLLVDLAHCSMPAVDYALQVSRKPMVWSHGWVDSRAGDWRDKYGFQRRRLSLEHARKMAERGGVIGLWGLGLSQPGPSRLLGKGVWTVGREDTRSYAAELVNLVDRLGRDHVAFGTDIEGFGQHWSVNEYGHLRRVVEHLQEMKMPADTIDRITHGNYVRVLKDALGG